MPNIAKIINNRLYPMDTNIISSRTLRLLDEITNTNISGETSVQILNSLYYIQHKIETKIW